MPDREKVIDELDWLCTNAYDWNINGIVLGKPVGEIEMLFEDAIALLKEQKPVRPISRFNKLLNKTIYWCGKCDTNIEKDQSYCGCCGRPVKWND